MKILYVGDIMGSPGRQIVKELLPALKAERAVDLVVAQAENVTHGKGMSVAHMRELQAAGVDVFTGGNWTGYVPDSLKALKDPAEPIIKPANFDEVEGKGWFIVPTKKGKVLVVSLLGQTVGKDAGLARANPLHVIDEILEKNADAGLVASVINFHGDLSSEKRVIGYYLDGRVSLVVGDHWHIPTADAMVLPKGTAHITDVGMCGTVHSSLGIKADVIIERWHSGRPSRNELDESDRRQFCAVLADIDEKTGLATGIEQIINYRD